MKMQKKTWIIIAIIVCLICGIVLAVKFVEHEKQQRTTIENLILQNEKLISQNEDLMLQNENLTEQVNSLNSALETANEAIEELKQKIVQSRKKYNKDGFNYLALGNSITKHGKNDYWWNEVGMAATEEENDYFHLVSNYLKSNNDNSYSLSLNYSVWELNAHDRSQTFNMIDPYLSDKLDLVSIQLSENASDLTTFRADYTELIKHIKKKCPNAQIILIDDFWSDEKANLKKEIASTNNILFADLGEIRGVEEYKCGLNTIVYGDDGKEHTVEHKGVAAHPGDKGMKFIADTIIDLIETN